MGQKNSICFLKCATHMKKFQCFTDLFTVPHTLLMYIQYIYMYIYIVIHIYIYMFIYGINHMYRSQLMLFLQHHGHPNRPSPGGDRGTSTAESASSVGILVGSFWGTTRPRIKRLKGVPQAIGKP